MELWTSIVKMNNLVIRLIWKFQVNVGYLLFSQNFQNWALLQSCKIINIHSFSVDYQIALLISPYSNLSETLWKVYLRKKLSLSWAENAS